jgi:predicted RNase H-like HicB family nuclease
VNEYLVIIEPAEDESGSGAYVPDLPGCVATGRTREEARQRIVYSIPCDIASLRAHGDTVRA